MSFETLGLNPDLLRALSDLNHSSPTPIQMQTIPPIIEGRDVLGVAQTGSGKTGGFLLPSLHRNRRAHFNRTRHQILVLSPTRELAGQIERSAREYGKYIRSRSVLLVGGTDMRRQIDNLRRPWDLVIATPGRLLDHMQRGTISLSHVHTVVLDEADRMLDMGFLPDVESILDALPPERQTLLFTATLPARIQNLTKTYQKNPVLIRLESSGAPPVSIEQEVITISHGSQKWGLLKTILTEPQTTEGQTLIFTRTKRGAEDLSDALLREGFPSDALHGDKSQSQRNRVLSRFRGGQVQILVATDVAARGLDIDTVTCVVNYDLPQSPEDYVHRIGRTGRAGRSGRAISFCHPADRPILRDIERLVGTTVPVSPLSPPPSPSSSRPSRSDRPSFRQGSGGRSDRFGDSRPGFRSGNRSEGPSDGRSDFRKDRPSGGFRRSSSSSGKPFRSSTPRPASNQDA
jgi:ATP-dependent RNA helicase RhlE